MTSSTDNERGTQVHIIFINSELPCIIDMKLLDTLKVKVLGHFLFWNFSFESFVWYSKFCVWEFSGKEKKRTWNINRRDEKLEPNKIFSCFYTCIVIKTSTVRLDFFFGRGGWSKAFLQPSSNSSSGIKRLYTITIIHIMKVRRVMKFVQVILSSPWLFAKNFFENCHLKNEMSSKQLKAVTTVV